MLQSPQGAEEFKSEAITEKSGIENSSKTTVAQTPNTYSNIKISNEETDANGSTGIAVTQENITVENGSNGGNKQDNEFSCSL